MSSENNDPVRGQDINDEGIFSDSKTREKIHRHLSDENDEISEDDLKNIITVPKIGNSDDPAQNGSAEKAGIDKAALEDNKDTEEKKDTEDPPITTPWNILGS